MVICEFNYCIYNKKGECILKSIIISPLGMCDDCIIPDIDDKTLDKCKKELLQRLEQNNKEKEQKKIQKVLD